MEIKLIPAQEKFLQSAKRFPCFIGGIGTGKTYMLLLKIWRFCETFPNTRALVVRREYTDLRDSTMSDFRKYFEVEVDGDKNYKFANGSVIMFRHGEELNILKNLSLDIAGVEQAEEFDLDQQFEYIRDRMRGTAGPYQQLCLIANAKGHNWLWRRWINNPASDEFDGVTATTFDNECNLSPQYVKDMRARAIDAPNHFAQMVMNSFEDVEATDLLFRHAQIYNAQSLILPDTGGRYLRRVMGIDVARFGDDETVFSIIEQRNLFQFEQIFQECHRGKDIPWVTGRAAELENAYNTDLMVVDEGGLGSGVVDLLSNGGHRTIGFVSQGKADSYENNRWQGYFSLAELVDKGQIKLLNDMKLADQLGTIRYAYKNNQEKYILSKKILKDKYKVKSPDCADALMMAVWGKDLDAEERVQVGRQSRLPEYAVIDEDKFNDRPDLQRYAINN